MLCIWWLTPAGSKLNKSRHDTPPLCRPGMTFPIFPSMSRSSCPRGGAASMGQQRGAWAASVVASRSSTCVPDSSGAVARYSMLPAPHQGQSPKAS